MKDRFWIAFLVCIDLLTASASWGLFFLIRQVKIEEKPFHADQNFWLGVILLPFFWLLFYIFQGTYHEIRRLFRLKVINLSLAALFLVPSCFFSPYYSTTKYEAIRIIINSPCGCFLFI